MRAGSTFIIFTTVSPVPRKYKIHNRYLIFTAQGFPELLFHLNLLNAQNQHIQLMIFSLPHHHHQKPTLLPIFFISMNGTTIHQLSKPTLTPPFPSHPHSFMKSVTSTLTSLKSVHFFWVFVSDTMVLTADSSLLSCLGQINFAKP